jgi:hypothetical protein
MDVDRVWDLTPHQLARFFEGAKRSRQHAREMQAWEMSHMLSAWSKKPVKMAQLLGRRGSVSASDYASLAEFRAAIAERKEEQGES